MLDIAASVLALTALLAWVNQRWLRLPTTIGVMATSLALSLALVGLDAAGLAVGLHANEERLVRSIDFSQLLMQGMLSLLLFAGALHVDLKALRDYRWQVGVLAFVGTALSTVLVGAALWAALGALGLSTPLIACLLFGALISPTDPIAVIGMLKSAGAPRNLEVVIAGESLFNDGVGVVLFVLLLEMAAEGGAPTLAHGAALLAQEAGGGLLFGWALGFVLCRLLRGVDAHAVAVLLTLAGVIGGYTLANDLHVSGPLAMVVVGLMVGHAGREGRLPVETQRHLGVFWELVDDVLNAVLFVLVGMEVITIRIPVGPAAAVGAGLAAIAITLAARWLTVGLPVTLARRASRLPAGAGGLLTWGGLRGGLSLALALALPAGPWRETLIALTYAVVAFSILVQGLTFGRLVRARLRRDACAPHAALQHEPRARRSPASRVEHGTIAASTTAQGQAVDLKVPITISDELGDDIIESTGLLDLASGEIQRVEYEDWDLAARGLPADSEDYEFTVGTLSNNGKDVEFKVDVNKVTGQYSVSASELLEIKVRAAALFAGISGKDMLRNADAKAATPPAGGKGRKHLH